MGKIEKKKWGQADSYGEAPYGQEIRGIPGRRTRP